ncbi:signal recognition particle-docking protein FtsY [Paraburkholderia caballeronis]|uniref:signal recognition particle-docking protein FtsY n=1 Tax=Paraburkholderia caballeronis TaxID=416943 RepID=UPI001066B8E3|nr:signal recognition particle-docking protein FtsY [Paraburkholderia caballeronis]
MFSFFKRFRGSKSSDNAPAEAAAAPETEAPDAQSEAAPAVEPAAPTSTGAAAPAAGTSPTAPEAAPVIESPAPVQPIAPAVEAETPVAVPEARQPAVEPAPVAPAAPQTVEPQPAPPSAHAPSPPVSAAPPVPAPQQAPARPAPAPATMAAATAPQPRAAESATADTVETVEIVPPPAPEPAAKKSWLARLKSGLSKTSSNITSIFVNAKIDDDLYEELETALLMSDAGVDATEYLLDALRAKVRAERLTDAQQVKVALRTLLIDLLKPLEKSLMLGRTQPLVMMIAGVNGAGKTTSIGKLAKHLQRFDQSVLLAAGDTFRAAAREQLAIWGERNNVTVVSQESGDPAAVIFDAVGAARARGIDVLMADTAGRLPTQLHLMEELRKVKRVIGKALDGAPHEVLLVIDANTGQNALAQVKAFDDALGLTGLIVTKLDGTAKGGILAAIARQRPVPVYFIGVGEKVEDLQPFSAEEFSDALLGN